ncbi:MAG: hypothetical protein IKI11_05935 [Neisseriaceae bacterium]|nr:hypothetical protein [Neisseriaceae bacterium]
MSKYKTSAYLSVALNFDLACDWWDLSEEQRSFVYDLLQDWDKFETWLEQHKDEFEDYKEGEKKRQKIIANHPDDYPLFVYAHWLHLQNGALLNTLLFRYDYGKICSQKGAYLQAADFFELLFEEYSKLSIIPPNIYDAAEEQKMIRECMEKQSDGE